MIEREFVKDKVKYMKVREYIIAQIPKGAGIGDIQIEKTPLGERIQVYVVRPGLIIGRAGKTISDLTSTLKNKYKMENPQIEVKEITVPATYASVVARRMAGDMERFGPSRYKTLAYKALQEIMSAGALGAEIRIAGRGVPGERAQAWRFPAGYMKKCGQVALEGVDIAQAQANLRSGTVGIQVRIMPSTLRLPDRVRLRDISELAQAAEKQKADEKAKDRKTAEQKAQKIGEPKKEKITHKKKPAAEIPAEQPPKEQETQTAQEVKQ